MVSLGSRRIFPLSIGRHLDRARRPSWTTGDLFFTCWLQVLLFGGGYATLLALPFLFAAFSLVAAYLSNPSHDKGFVRIGLALAGGFFFAPLASAPVYCCSEFRLVGL